MSVLDEAFGIKEYMVEQRNYFHSHPELAHKEFNTCNHIEEELQKTYEDKLKEIEQRIDKCLNSSNNEIDK